MRDLENRDVSTMRIGEIGDITKVFFVDNNKATGDNAGRMPDFKRCIRACDSTDNIFHDAHCLRDFIHERKGSRR